MGAKLLNQDRVPRPGVLGSPLSTRPPPKPLDSALRNPNQRSQGPDISTSDEPHVPVRDPTLPELAPRLKQLFVNVYKKES